MASPESHVEVELEALVQRAYEVEVEHFLDEAAYVVARAEVVVERLMRIRAEHGYLSKTKTRLLSGLCEQLETLAGRVHEAREAQHAAHG